jgi:hypothetical protein
VLHYLATPSALLGTLLAVAVGLYGHNLVQTWVARSLGDRSAVRDGFGALTWRQLDSLGVVCVLLTYNAWGFAAPVPMDLRRRRRTRAIVALLSGPVFLLALTGGFAAAYDQLADQSGFGARVVFAAVVSSAGLFVTSMIPIPPLALGRALWLFAPPAGGWATARYRLEDDNLGRFVALAILLLPLLISAFPDVVGEFVTPLLRDFRVLAR